MKNQMITTCFPNFGDHFTRPHLWIDLSLPKNIPFPQGKMMRIS